MKKLLTTILALTFFASFTQICLAEFTVQPVEPYDRQFIMEIAAGESAESSIRVSNLGNDPITVKTYGADGTNSNQGTFALTTLSKEQKHIGQWVTFQEETTTIEPKQEALIPFKITIPENTTPGNYGGGIAVEASAAQLNGNGELEGTQGGQVTTSARIFSKIFVRIPGDKIHKYEWTNFGFNGGDASERSTFHFSFKNNGNTIVLAKPTIKLTGFPPLKNNIIELPEATIQPGTEVNDIQKRWDNKPSFGFYFAKTTVEFAEFDIINNEKTNPETFTKNIRINLTPTYITVIIAGVIILLITYLIVTYVLIREFTKSCKKYKVAKGETLPSIANDYNTSWKRLAKINKIKKPYVLKANQTILVPPKK